MAKAAPSGSGGGFFSGLANMFGGFKGSSAAKPEKSKNKSKPVEKKSEMKSEMMSEAMDSAMDSTYEESKSSNNHSYRGRGSK